MTEPAPLVDLLPEDRFHLDPAFVSAFEERQPAWGGAGLGYLVFKRTYARPLPDDSTEEYWQTCRRVVEGVFTIQAWHHRKQGLEFDRRQAELDAEQMYLRMWQFKMLPPGRGLWAMGSAHVWEFGSASLLNCAFRSSKDIATDFAAPFVFAMDLSMLGVGVGYDTRGAGTMVPQLPEQGSDVHVVDDSREGWVELVKRVLDAYAGRGALPAEIDYSQIRPAGAPLKRFGGTAGGPEPLVRCVGMLRAILDREVGRPISSTAIVDLMDSIGVCVVAGNLRRSALIALGDPNDREFRELKDPDLHPEELKSHRWASNNSVLIRDGDEVDYEGIAASIAKNGEPGVIWLDNLRRFGRMADPADHRDHRVEGVNPCSEQALEDGELCCLAETFPSRHDTYSDLRETLRIAHLYAKTVTLLPLHVPMSDEIQRRNRRMGISMTGVVQALERHGKRRFVSWCDRGHAFLRKLDDEVSARWQVPTSIKLSTVKPSGTVSTLPYVTPGVHFEHAEYYFRTVRVAMVSKLLEPLRAAGYRVEPDLVDPSSSVVYFPIKPDYFERSKSQVSVEEQFEMAALMQRHWSDNAVSITVTFRPEEAHKLAGLLRQYAPVLKTVSCLPLVDHQYEQAPYIEISRAEYESAVAALASGGTAVRLSGDTHEAEDKMCDGEACVLPAASDRDAEPPSPSSLTQVVSV